MTVRLGTHHASRDFYDVSFPEFLAERGARVK